MIPSRSVGRGETNTKKKHTNHQRDMCSSLFNYLLGAFIIGNVGLDAKGPFYVQVIFLQSEQEHNQDEQRVHHKECKH